MQHSQHSENQLNFIKNEKIRNFIDDFTTSISPQISSMLGLILLIIYIVAYFEGGFSNGGDGLALFWGEILRFSVGVSLVLLGIFLFKFIVFLLSLFNRKIYIKIRLPLNFYFLYVVLLLIALMLRLGCRLDMVTISLVCLILCFAICCNCFKKYGVAFTQMCILLFNFTLLATYLYIPLMFLFYKLGI